MKTYDATEQAYKNGYKKGYEEGFKEGYEGGVDVGKRNAVKHGRWIPVYDEEHLSHGIKNRIGDACSACKKAVRWSPGSYDYCPNCGARMDGGNEDECD